MGQPISQTINQSINQSIDQFINPSNHQNVCDMYWYYCFLSVSLCCAALGLALCSLFISSFQERANTMARRPSSVYLSVNFCANRFFSQANGRIATKLAQDGLQVSMHPGCAQGQGQGQRSRDTGRGVDGGGSFWGPCLSPPIHQTPKILSE